MLANTGDRDPALREMPESLALLLRVVKDMSEPYVRPVLRTPWMRK
jgi:hypothetical protein